MPRADAGKPRGKSVVTALDSGSLADTAAWAAGDSPRSKARRRFEEAAAAEAAAAAPAAPAAPEEPATPEPATTTTPATLDALHNYLGPLCQALLGATPLCAGYYHFITDLLPRLILGSRVARDAALLVPRDALTRTRHAFVDGFLRRAGVEMGRVEGLDVVPRRFARAASARASVKRLLFVDWATTRPDDDVAAWHLPPFAALRVVRAALGAAGRPPEHRTVVVVLRRRAPTRRLAADAERAVLDAAERVASEFDLATTIFSDEAPADAAATLRLFRPAALVVGVHGAGLTNALFCTVRAARARPPESARAVLRAPRQRDAVALRDAASDG